MEQGTHLEDGGVSTHLVIGVGDVHGGDAQEVNEGCIVAASTQRAQPVGRKTMGLEATGPSDLPTPVPAPAPGSPGDQAVHGTAIVRIPDPVVVDAESAGAWRGDLQGGEPSLGLAPPQTQQQAGAPPNPLPSTCLAAEKTTLWTGGVPCTLREALAVGGSEKDSIRAPALSFLSFPVRPVAPPYRTLRCPR